MLRLPVGCPSPPVGGGCTLAPPPQFASLDAQRPSAACAETKMLINMTWGIENFENPTPGENYFLECKPGV